LHRIQIAVAVTTGKRKVWLCSAFDSRALGFAGSAGQGLHQKCAIFPHAQKWGFESLISSLDLPDCSDKAASEGADAAPAIGGKPAHNGATRKLVV
jgi:hypothetical protein